MIVTEFFEAFQPSMRHWREQKALEKMLVLDTHQTGRGRPPVDLESGRITIEVPSGLIPGAPISTPRPDDQPAASP